MDNGPLGPQGRFFQSLRLMKASPFGMPSGVVKRSKNFQFSIFNFQFSIFFVSWVASQDFLAQMLAVQVQIDFRCSY